jgi:protein arginine kinase
VIDTNLRFGDREGDWLSGQGPASDIVVSSRVRLARNIAGFPFVNKASEAERQQIVALVSDKAQDWAGGMIFIDMNEISSLDRNLLVERHLISTAHVKGGQPRGVAITQDESVAIMVNEEDHLRMQVLGPGLQLEQVYGRITGLDDQIEEEVDYSFSDRFGYLTACPTNVGTAIRFSVMLHLPALRLVGEIEKVRRAAKDMQLALRGFHGEGSEATGDFYQLSNQTTLGQSEEEILRDFADSVLPSVLDYEQSARRSLIGKRRTYVEDQVWRAWGVLTSARLLDTNETLQLLSMVRLGCSMELLPQADMHAINALLLLSQPAHLQRMSENRMTQAERAAARATLVRSRLLGE